MSETEQQVADGVIEMLRAAGASDEEIRTAERDGVQGLFALFADRTFVPGSERLTRQQVEERAALSGEEASAFWRALGFPDAPEDEPMFTEVDAEMLSRVKDLLHSGVIDRDIALQNTRVMGRAMAQIAASLVDTIRGRLVMDGNAPPPALLAAGPVLLEDLERWLVYIWRRHFAAEVKRAATQFGATEAGTAVVGFADLVGFTGMSRQLSETELAAAVSSFESTAVDLVGARGGRVVKMIGDEVMFEAPNVKSGADVALDLVDAFAADGKLPDVRAGLAFGNAVRNQGDLFGEAPNLASRLVDQAYPGTVLVSEGVHDELAEETDYEFKAVLPRILKGFGRTRFWVLRRPGSADKVPLWKVRLPKLADIAKVFDEG